MQKCQKQPWRALSETLWVPRQKAWLLNSQGSKNYCLHLTSTKRLQNTAAGLWEVTSGATAHGDEHITIYILWNMKIIVRLHCMKLRRPNTKPVLFSRLTCVISLQSKEPLSSSIPVAPGSRRVRGTVIGWEDPEWLEAFILVQPTVVARAAPAAWA